MLAVVDKLLIQYSAEEAVAAGVQDLIFVTGRHKRAIEDHFDASPEFEAKGKLLKKVHAYRYQAVATTAVASLDCGKLVLTWVNTPPEMGKEFAEWLKQSEGIRHADLH